MKPSFFITLAVSAAICVFAIMAKANKNDELAQRLADEQVEHALREQAERKRSAEIRQGKIDESSSAERIDLAVAKIRALEVPDPKEIPVTMYDQYLRAMDESSAATIDLLRAVQDFSFDELIAVASEVSDETSRKTLLLLAAEADPMRIYEDDKWRSKLSWIEMANALSNHINPTAALRLVPVEEHKARILIAFKMLAADSVSGLELFAQLMEYSAKSGGPGRNFLLKNYGGASITDLPAEAIPEILSAIGKPEYGAIKRDILKIAVKNLMYEGGVDEVIEQFGAIQITGDESSIVLSEMHKLGSLMSNPIAVADWVSKDSPDRLPRTVKRWAELDQRAVADWLVQQEPSPAKDNAIATFAQEAAKLDREAAVAWAQQISDSNLREKTLRKFDNQ